MTKLEMPRTVRDRLRKRFPRDAPDVTKLGYPALASWLNESHFQRTLFPLWTPQGFRWRRASMRAMTEYSDRLLAHKGGVPGLCDHCQLRPATSHVAYQPQEDPRFGH